MYFLFSLIFFTNVAPFKGNQTGFRTVWELFLLKKHCYKKEIRDKTQISILFAYYRLIYFIIPGVKSQSIAGGSGSPVGTCASKHGWRVWRSWCISSLPELPGYPDTAPSCSPQPEHESHCVEVGCLQTQMIPS